MIIKTTLLALTLAAVSAPMAFAKGHDQGINSKNRGDVSATVEAAKTLGGSQRNAAAPAKPQ